MPYFPFFVDITGRPCLIVGGGRIALHKIRKLLPFSPEIHVAAPDISPEIEALPGLHISHRDFTDSDLDGMSFVIAATDDAGVNSYVARLCLERNIPCNAVDQPESCTFFFPALVQRGDITVGISTSGKSPLLAAELRRQTEELITPEMAEICSLMGCVRGKIRGRFHTEAGRKTALTAALGFCLREENPDEERLMRFIDELEINK